MFKELQRNAYKKIVVDSLIKESRTSISYFILLIISALITTLGLTLNNAAVVIGGMLIAPLLTPILAMGLGFATLSTRALSRASIGIMNSVSSVILVSFLASLVLHDGSYLTDEMVLRGNLSHLYLYIAFLSGFGATYAWVEKKVAYTLPGVAVAVSLLPPLCVAGISLAQNNGPLLVNSFLIFILNFIGIVMASMLVFLVFSFPKLRKFQDQVITNEEEKTE